MAYESSVESWRLQQRASGLPEIICTPYRSSQRLERRATFPSSKICNIRCGKTYTFPNYYESWSGLGPYGPQERPFPCGKVEKYRLHHFIAHRIEGPRSPWSRQRLHFEATFHGDGLDTPIPPLLYVNPRFRQKLPLAVVNGQFLALHPIWLKRVDSRQHTGGLFRQPQLAGDHRAGSGQSHNFSHQKPLPCLQKV